MAVSTTRKKSADITSITDAEVAVDFATSMMARYVTDWTTREIKKIMSRKIDMVMVEYDANNYIVGRYRIHKHQDHWACTDAFSDHYKMFYLKISAILYALSRSAGYHAVSDQILNQDAVAGKHREDVMMYRQRLAQSQKSDDFKRNLWISRLSDSELKLKLAMKHLQKSLSRAKYLKVWTD